MDTTRVSVARLLELEVPLTWQEAVAVVQGAAMLSDVNAAMNSRPSLVNPETCFITRTGDLELPVTTDVEQPDALPSLLREMIAGRDAPEALEALAFEHATRDMSGALERFPIGNRRATIAKLAARALARQSGLGRTPPAAPSATSHEGPPPVAVSKEGPPPVEVSAEWRELREKSANAAPSTRSRIRLLMSGRAPWLAGGMLATAALAALVWPVSGTPKDAPALLETVNRPGIPAAVAFAVPVQPRPPGVAAMAALTSAPVLGVASSSSGPGRREVATPPASGAAPVRVSPAIASARPASQTPALERSAGVMPAARMSTRAPDQPAEGVVAPALTRGESAPSPASTPPAAVGRGFEPGVAARAAPESSTSSEIFSADDADVSAPTLRRQQLPTAVRLPGTDVPEGWPYLVLVVDTTGVVESVRLHARPPAPGESLYHHQMLIAAAKAWQFEPARKHGQPVRYEVRMPLEP